MDHKEQHHQKHEKDREEKKKEEKAHESQEMKSALPFHPAWLVVLGVGLVAAALMIWTFLL
jgi:ABC-type nickel/cobalt efflux system permease component RcnA